MRPTAQDKKVVKTFTDNELQFMIMHTTGAAKKMFLAEAGRRVAEQMKKEAKKNPPTKKTRGKVRVNPRGKARPDLFKPPYQVQVDSERDNLNIWLSDRDDKNIAHWHDDDARQMIEDGFFSDKGGKKLADSVVEYARSVGMIK